MRITLVFLGVLLLVSSDPARAERLRPGQSIPDIRLMDQHDAEGRLDATTRLVLVTRDMDAGNLVKDALTERGGATLTAAHAVYISDISRMPGLITKLFALPAMRKRDYRILLDRDGKATADIPSEEGKITALRIADGVIAQIDYVSTVEGLRMLLTGK